MQIRLFPQALHPAMSAWRKRLGFITERFEAAGKSEKLKELPALSEASESKAAKQEAGQPEELQQLPALSEAGKNETVEEEASLDPARILRAAHSLSESVQVCICYWLFANL